VLASIVALPCLSLTDVSLVEEAIELAHKSSQEFADAYIAASAARAGATKIATFNQKHFDRMDAKLHPLKFQTTSYFTFCRLFYCLLSPVYCLLPKADLNRILTGPANKPARH
jgi:hypothetical protein